ncbi:MAG: hypothetical protein SPK96_02480 [Bacteroidaceae bacterium]|nr:hypothetical protein [Bacteroidaceae bacterium]
MVKLGIRSANLTLLRQLPNNLLYIFTFPRKNSEALYPICFHPIARHSLLADKSIHNECVSDYLCCHGESKTCSQVGSFASIIFPVSSGSTKKEVTQALASVKVCK